MTVPEISIVATMYKSQDYVVEFCERVNAAMSLLGKSFEIILVNDGSPGTVLQKSPGNAVTDSEMLFSSTCRETSAITRQ